MNRLLITLILLLVCLPGASCSSTPDFDSQLKTIIEPYVFSIADWEFGAISDEIRQLIFDREGEVEGELALVTEYFSLVEQIKTLKSEIEAINNGGEQEALTILEARLNIAEEQRAALESGVEAVVKKQIRETLTQQGIFNPVYRYVRLGVSFPPLSFRLEETPYLLVISPRDRIERMRQINLKQDISLEEIEDIEAEADKLGVSSLVVGLGGLATYPSLVTNDASLQFTIDTVTEEWLHRYLAFTPLGFLYLLDVAGVARNYDIVTMNETITSMVSKEIGSMVREKYYGLDESGSNRTHKSESDFDFNQEMREIRKAVDKYLAQGEIEQAEEFMKEKRQYLASKGYHLRKLNQAYFAFYGAYADSPAYISPIGLELKELRGQSESLGDFLSTVAVMTSRQNLSDSLK